MEDLVRKALDELAERGQVTIEGLGRLQLDKRVIGSFRNPFTGELQVIAPRAARRLRFIHSRALKAVIGDRPMPTRVELDVESIVAAYPVVPWGIEQLSRALTRCDRKRSHPKRLARFEPALWYELVRWLRPERSLHGPEHAFGTPHKESRFLFDRNGDGWILEREGEDPQVVLVMHEGDRAEPVGLSALIAGWLFYDEVMALVGTGYLAASVADRLQAHFDRLLPPEARGAVFDPFPF